MAQKRRKEQLSAPALQGRVALVTGASRGAGRGIAAVLGECGAVVYVTGRSVRGRPTTDNMPGTIEDTAEEVTRRGGQGIAVRCDHTSAEDVRNLVARIRAGHGRLDILVNNAWGGYEGERPMPGYFWKAPLGHWESMIENGVKAHLLASYFAIPLMLEPSSRKAAPGLIAGTVAWDRDNYIGHFYDLSKHAIVRMLWGLAMELRPFRIATVALAPGFMRTERVMSHAGGETDWKKIPWLKKSESPEYVGRAVAALAADGGVMRKSGKALHVGELAREYGFTDIDGRLVPPFRIGTTYMRMIRRSEKPKAP